MPAVKREPPYTPGVQPVIDQDKSDAGLAEYLSESYWVGGDLELPTDDDLKDIE